MQGCACNIREKHQDERGGYRGRQAVPWPGRLQEFYQEGRVASRSQQAHGVSISCNVHIYIYMTACFIVIHLLYTEFLSLSIYIYIYIVHCCTMYSCAFGLQNTRAYSSSIFRAQLSKIRLPGTQVSSLLYFALLLCDVIHVI